MRDNYSLAAKLILWMNGRHVQVDSAGPQDSSIELLVKEFPDLFNYLPEDTATQLTAPAQPNTSPTPRSHSLEDLVSEVFVNVREQLSPLADSQLEARFNECVSADEQLQLVLDVLFRLNDGHCIADDGNNKVKHNETMRHKARRMVGEGT